MMGDLLPGARRSCRPLALLPCSRPPGHEMIWRSAACGSLSRTSRPRSRRISGDFARQVDFRRYSSWVARCFADDGRTHGSAGTIPARRIRDPPPVPRVAADWAADLRHPVIQQPLHFGLWYTLTRRSDRCGASAYRRPTVDWKPYYHVLLPNSATHSSPSRQSAKLISPYLASMLLSP